MADYRLIDLASQARGERAKPYDFCIIGAGAIGLYVAARLARAGASIAIIDRGARTPGPPTDDDQPAFDLDRYSAATEGRDFGFGGTTSRWGALLVPHLESDHRGNRDWKHIVETVRRQSPRVLQRLGWKGVGVDDSFWLGHPRLGRESELGGAVTPTRSLYLPFRRKNLTWLLRHGGADQAWAAPDIIINATAASWTVTSDDVPSIDTVLVRSRNGQEVKVAAGRFLITAGTIESTRIALEIKEAVKKEGHSGFGRIGYSLSDHLSVSIGRMTGQGGRWATDNLGFWFERGWMRGCRLVGRDPGRFDARSFLHPVFHSDGQGFAVVREALRSIQRRKLPKLRPSEYLSALPTLPRFAVDRWARRRVYFEPGTTCSMQMDVEQAADDDNQILLMRSQRDWSGRARFAIRWRISDGDRTNIRRAAAAYADAWASTTGLPRWRSVDDEIDDRRPHDAYHPVGTCRLGLDDDAVVDAKLRLRGVANAWIASTAVLPTAGSANPTFSALCLADHAIDCMLADRG